MLAGGMQPSAERQPRVWLPDKQLWIPPSSNGASPAPREGSAAGSSAQLQRVYMAAAAVSGRPACHAARHAVAGSSFGIAAHLFSTRTCTDPASGGAAAGGVPRLLPQRQCLVSTKAGSNSARPVYMTAALMCCVLLVAVVCRLGVTILTLPAVLQTRGRKRCMEDRHVLAALDPASGVQQAHGPVGLQKQVSVAAVFDGHAGYATAAYAAQHIPHLLHEALSGTPGRADGEQGT